MRTNRSYPTRVALLVSFSKLLVISSLAASDQTGASVTSELSPTTQRQVSLEIVDAQTGRWTPARFSLEIDGNAYEPPSLNEHGLRFRSVHESKKQTAIMTYARGTGPVQLTVPNSAQRIVLHVAKGFAYRPVSQSIRNGADDTSLTVTLNQWTDLTERGWVASDAHVHYDRLHPTQDSDWLTMLAGDHLNQAHFMILKGGKVPGIWAQQHQYGRDGETATASQRLISGEEYRDSAQGHINLLGLNEVIQPISTGGLGSPPVVENFPPLYEVLKETRRRGGHGGVAHGGAYGRQSTAILDTVLGAVDFFEITNAHLYNTPLWYRLLNCGFLIPPAGGTDLPNYPFRDPWQPFLGSMRMYVESGGDHRLAAWMDALKAGKVFVTSGPLLSFEINQQPIGSTLQIAQPETTLQIKATLSSPRPLHEFELIQNGQVIEVPITRQSADGIQSLTIDTRVPIRSSSWFAVRGRGIPIQSMVHSVGTRSRITETDAIAHSGIIRVLVQDQPIRSQADAAFLVGELFKQRAFYERVARYKNEQDRATMLQLFDRGIERLKVRQRH